MYERHKRRYSLCAKGERAVDVVLIKVGYLSVLSNKVVWYYITANAKVITVILAEAMKTQLLSASNK